MPTTRRDQLRREYVAGVCDTLKQYVLDGHAFHMQTEHEEQGESRLTFQLDAWETFAEMLERDWGGRDCPF